MSSHRFELEASWTGSVDGHGSLKGEGLEAKFTAPVALGGQGGGTNPEELLLGAAGACYLITCSAILTRRKIPFLGLRVRSDATVENTEGIRMTQIRHFPTIRLPVGSSAEVENAALTAARLAEQVCLVSVAVRGNVAMEVHPTTEK